MKLQPSVLAALLLFFALLNTALAQENSYEQKVARTMRSIGAAWQKAIDERHPLVTEFRSGCFVVHFLEKPVTLEYDVRRTGQLLNPFVGFVRLAGKVTRNDEPTPSERYYKCFATADQAISSAGTARAREWVNSKSDMVAEYKITDTDITLDKINDEFKSAFYPWLLKSENKNLWSSMVSRRIN